MPSRLQQASTHGHYSHLLIVAAVAMSTIQSVTAQAPYSWATGPFTTCAGGCGRSRTQTRIVACTDSGSNPVDDSNCDGQTRPDDTVSCARIDCNPRAEYGSFSVCRRCLRNRTQECVQRVANGSLLTLSNGECGLSSGMDVQVCGSPLCSPVWQRHPYNCCDDRAALGIRCWDTSYDVLVDDVVCDTHPATKNITRPPPANCTDSPGCPTILARSPVPTTSAPPASTEASTTSETGTTSVMIGSDSVNATAADSNTPMAQSTPVPVATPLDGSDGEIGKLEESAAAKTGTSPALLASLISCVLVLRTW